MESRAIPAATTTAGQAPGDPAVLRASPVSLVAGHVEIRRSGAGPAAWANDLSPIAADEWSFDRAAHLLERAGFGGTPEEIAQLAAMTPADAVAPPRRLSRHPQRSPPAVRSVGRVGSLAQGLSAEPRRGDRACREGRRGAGRAREAVGRAAPAAGRRPLLLLAARDDARDPASRVLVGRPHGRDQPSAGREDGPVLARPFRHRRRKDPRLSQDGAATCAAAPRRDRQFPHTADRSRARAGDARLSRRRRERERRPERELCPRGDGTLHHGRRQLHREGYPRSGARLHRLDRRRSRLQGRPRKARRRTEDLPRPNRQLRRRRHPQHHSRAEGHGRIHGRQDLSVLRAREYFARDAGAARRRAARRQLRDRAAAAHDLPVEGFLQRAVVRHPHQGAGRAHGLDLSQARGRSACPAFRTSTWSAASLARCCSTRRRSPAGRRAARGSRPGCCSHAAISPAT